ncbi:bZIP transcription factor HacA [Histoplasma ohiense]|nr:bZIP transcription factor HacA [Histoplasma ohiense (nom. inval.)]
MTTPFSYLGAMSPPPCSDPLQLTVAPAETTFSFAHPVTATTVPLDTTTVTTTTAPTTTTTAAPAAPAAPAAVTATIATTLPPKPEEKKPVKKRKSWGQELPTPKTNLPPRKRAKTEDEKEQRRIERVLRNRAAAQTSRERKRLEVEKLEGEKLEMEHQNGILLQRLAQMEAENKRLSQQVAQLSAEIRSSSSRGSSSRGSSPQSIVSGLTSPNLLPAMFKQERDEMVSLDNIPFLTPPISAYSPSVKSCDLTDSSDLTQHPAAMLCDLQCQSEASLPSTAPQLLWRPPQASPSPSSTPAPIPLSLPLLPPLTQQLQQQLLLKLAILSIIQHLFQTMTSTAYSTLLIPLIRIFHSLKQGSPLTFSPPEIQQHLPLILWLISTPTQLTSTAPTTITTTTPPPPALPQRASDLPTSSRPVFRIRLFTRLLACSPALARPLRDATSKALQLVASGAALDLDSPLASPVSGSVLMGRGDGSGGQFVDSSNSSRCRRRVVGYGLLAMIRAIDCIERAKARKRTWKLTTQGQWLATGLGKAVVAVSVRRRRALQSRTRLSGGGGRA